MKRFKAHTGRMAIYIILLAGVGMLMGGLRTCKSTPLAALQQGNSGGDTIDAGILYGPLSYYIWNDTLGGLNYDMLRALSSHLNRPIKFWPVVNITEGLQRLEAGRFNLLASLPAGRALKHRFLSTKSVFLDRMILVQLPLPDGSLRATSALHLAGDTIYIPFDSPAKSRLENLSREIGEPVAIKESKDLSEEYLCIKVAKGEIRYAVVNEKTAASMKRRYPALNIDNPVSFTQFQVWVLSRTDTVFLNQIDTWLEDYQATQAYKKLLERYAERSDSI